MPLLVTPALAHLIEVRRLSASSLGQVLRRWDRAAFQQAAALALRLRASLGSTGSHRHTADPRQAHLPYSRPSGQGRGSGERPSAETFTVRSGEVDPCFGLRAFLKLSLEASFLQPRLRFARAAESRPYDRDGSTDVAAKLLSAGSTARISSQLTGIA